MNKNFFMILLLVVSLLLVFYPILFQGKVLLPLDQMNTTILPYSTNFPKTEVFNHYLFDSFTQYYPYKALTKERLEAGELSYWNPYIFGGYPQYADTMGGHFDVTNMVLVLFKMPLAYHIQILLQLFIAGLGFYFLLIFYKVDRRIAIMFATAYMLNSMFMTTLLHRWLVASFCWVPYIIWMTALYNRDRKKSHLALGGLFTAFAFLGGNFQTSVYVVVVLICFHGFFSFFVLKKKTFRSLFLTPLKILFLGFGLSALMWLPSLELFWNDILDGGSRATGDLRSFSVFGVIKSLALLFSFVVPELAGSVRSFHLSFFAPGGGPIEFNGFIGFIPFLFGFWGCFYFWKKKIEMRPFIFLIVLSLIVTVATPLRTYLYYRFFMVYIFGMLVVGALAFNDFLHGHTNKKQGPQKWAKRFFILFLCLVIILIFGNIIVTTNYDYFFSQANKFIENNLFLGQSAQGNESWLFERVPKFIKHFWITSPTMFIPLICIGTFFSLLFLYDRQKKLPRNVFLWLCYFITVFQLSFFAYSWHPKKDSEKYPLYPEVESIQFIKSDPDIFRVLPFYLKTGEKKIFPPNMLSVNKVSTITGTESIRPRVLMNILTDIESSTFQVKAGTTYHGFNDYQIFSDSRFFQLLGLCNVKYIITNASQEFNSPDLSLVYSNEVNIYQNRQWKPRGFMVYQYEKRESINPSSKKLSEKSLNSLSVMFDQEPPQKINLRDSNVNNTVQIVAMESNSVRIQVQSDFEGYLVLSDTFYPGWQALVNGKKTEILRANDIMRAVVVPPGESIVKFVFHPLSFKIGLGISSATLFFLFGLFFRKRKSAQIS